MHKNPEMNMLHLIPRLKKLSGVREDPWGHIGEEISLSRIFSQSHGYCP